MAKRLSLRRTGGSVGVTIPSEMAERMALRPGDSVLAIDDGDGILIVPDDAEIKSQLDDVSAAIRKFRGALKALAKA